MYVEIIGNQIPDSPSTTSAVSVTIAFRIDSISPTYNLTGENGVPVDVISSGVGLERSGWVTYDNYYIRTVLQKSI